MANNMSTDGVRAAFGSASIDGSYNAEIAGVRFELYWDDQDPNNEGWWLRCIQPDGYEDGYAIAMAIAGPEDGEPDALPQPCRIISAHIPGVAEEIELTVCDCQPIPALDDEHAGETILAHRLYATHSGRVMAAGRVCVSDRGQLVAYVWDRSEYNCHSGIDAHRVLRALIHDDVRDLLDLLP